MRYHRKVLLIRAFIAEDKREDHCADTREYKGHDRGHDHRGGRNHNAHQGECSLRQLWHLSPGVEGGLALGLQDDVHRYQRHGKADYERPDQQGSDPLGLLGQLLHEVGGADKNGCQPSGQTRKG